MVCLGFKPGGVRMEGAEESTELRRHPTLNFSSWYSVRLGNGCVCVCVWVWVCVRERVLERTRERVCRMGESVDGEALMSGDDSQHHLEKTMTHILSFYLFVLL